MSANRLLDLLAHGDGQSAGCRGDSDGKTSKRVGTVFPLDVLEQVSERLVGGVDQLVATGLGDEVVVYNGDHERVVIVGADEPLEVGDAFDIAPADLGARLVEVLTPNAARRVVAPHVGVDLDCETFAFLVEHLEAARSPHEGWNAVVLAALEERIANITFAQSAHAHGSISQEHLAQHVVTGTSKEGLGGSDGRAVDGTTQMPGDVGPMVGVPTKHGES